MIDEILDLATVDHVAADLVQPDCLSKFRGFRDVVMFVMATWLASLRICYLELKFAASMAMSLSRRR